VRLLNNDVKLSSSKKNIKQLLKVALNIITHPLVLLFLITSAWHCIFIIKLSIVFSSLCFCTAQTDIIYNMTIKFINIDIFRNNHRLFCVYFSNYHTCKKKSLKSPVEITFQVISSYMFNNFA
jgi:hypothetical protein